ncbi:hypothetical protein CMV_027223 [Castanea mollissima]|uniref:Uncharacterized protein n=1 Tax=Castanea mollissima TaxID=60419 RepID=A0A8J4QIM2_9ROSI|nr:hypothetical protein CMV_027223 [Castanea mollissima]
MFWRGIKLWRGITTNEEENAAIPPNDCEEMIIDLPPQVLEPPPQCAECCIYRVPKRLRLVNGEAYTPKLISIGPFHHGKEELKDMEKQKLTYYIEFLQRTATNPRDIASIIAEKQQKIIYCYDGGLEISSQNILKIVLLDSIFIIEYFVRATAGGENGNNHMEPEKQKPPEKKVKHFTDLIRYIYYPSPSKLPTGDAVSYVYSATKLYEAGVRFKVIEGEGGFDKIKLKKWKPLGKCQCFNFSWLLIFIPCLKCFTCLEPTQSLLYLPSFVADNRTEELYRNIMALEQCHYPLEAYLCNYMVLLDHLINTGEDVELLADKGIIVNALGSYEVVAAMVNRIAVEIVEENSCYSDVAENLQIHYEKGCNRSIGYLKSTYFSNLWRGTATVVGLIILGFTLWDFVRSTIK